MADITKKQLGQRIQTLRKRAKLKQEAVADEIGIDAKSLSRIEGGSRFPSMEVLEKIALVLQVPLRELFEFPDTPAPADSLRQYLKQKADSLDEARLQRVVNAVRAVLGE